MCVCLCVFERACEKYLIRADRQPRASHMIQLDFVTLPLRHCYPLYVSLQLHIWRRSECLCVFVCVCVCLKMLTVEFRRGEGVWGGVSHKAGNAGERAPALSIPGGPSMSQVGLVPMKDGQMTFAAFSHHNLLFLRCVCVCVCAVDWKSHTREHFLIALYRVWRCLLAAARMTSPWKPP